MDFDIDPNFLFHLSLAVLRVVGAVFTAIWRGISQIVRVLLARCVDPSGTVCARVLVDSEYSKSLPDRCQRDLCGFRVYAGGDGDQYAQAFATP